LSEYPAKSVIVDLGCGDAALAKALLPKGLAVLSYDLVSDGAFVVEADCCGTIPLPGSEGEDSEPTSGEAHVADVVVCSLSLMGTNVSHLSFRSCMSQPASQTVAEHYSRSMAHLEARVALAFPFIYTSDVLLCRGELKIAEVASRFTDVNGFVSLVAQFGFQLTSKVRFSTTVSGYQY
jgi:ribosomal RNA-processing protein 8